jgi:hypothetical protein
MKILAKPSMVISRLVARFLALLNSLKTASGSNIEEGLDRLKKFSDVAIPTTIVVGNLIRVVLSIATNLG